MKRIAIVLGLGVGLAAAWVADGLSDRFDLDAVRARFPHPQQAEQPPEPGAAEPVTATWLGVSTVLIRDGETAILTDGFFSRPGPGRTLFGMLEPDPAEIEAALTRAGVSQLDAVAVGHSHYDHALDAGVVARRTGATLVGSRSTAQVGLGAGLSADRIRVPRPGEPLRFGEFTLWLIATRHLGASDGPALSGEITEPLVPPERVGAWREGGSYGVLLAHPRGRVLVQGSAGFLPGGYQGERADVVFLAIGGLGRMEADYRSDYLREVVDAVGATRVVPIHWDDFTRPLSEPLVAFPRLADRTDVGIEAVAAWQAAQPGRSVVVLRSFEPLPLF